MKHLTVLLLLTPAFAAEPLVIADFESGTYAPWTVEGEAFGPQPANGTLSGQMPVSGFAGKGLVNSFYGGDESKGRLTSPAFKVERKFITFLIGGGGYVDETCMKLIVGGKVVRSATGPNIKPGGSEKLSPAAWDVSEFIGRDASIIIHDSRSDGWGHINVDHLVQMDDRGAVPLAGIPAKLAPVITRALTIEADFLQLPLMDRERNDEPGVEKFTIEDDKGKVLRFMHLKLAQTGQTPDFWYSADVREFKGRPVTFRIKSHDPKALESLKLEDKEIVDPKAYAGPNRTRIHFSPRIGWMNDVNGSYYLDGLYHLFYQANPTTKIASSGFDMHWGHSVSRDLIHWEEWPMALFPNHTGNCWSGTSIVVKKPIPGLLENVPAPAMFFTGTSPFSQHLATTPDGGRTWKRFAGNPVVPTIGGGDRDPKVVWHEESKSYAMVLFTEKQGLRYVFLNSKDLKDWTIGSELPGWFECPEFFPIKSALTGETLWLLYGCYRSPKDAPKPFNSNSAYVLGKFDGKVFTPITEPRHAHLGPNYYAALLFDNAPDDRRIMMGWTRNTSFPGEPFNQSASLPLELKLKAFGGADTLIFEPAKEVEALRAAVVSDTANIQPTDEFDMEATFDAKQPVKVVLRSHEFTYDPATKELTLAKDGKVIARRIIHPDGTLDARILVDRGVIEAFWNGGEATFCFASLHTDRGPGLKTSSAKTLQAWSLKNIWSAK